MTTQSPAKESRSLEQTAGRAETIVEKLGWRRRFCSRGEYRDCETDRLRIEVAYDYGGKRSHYYVGCLSIWTISPVQRRERKVLNETFHVDLSGGIELFLEPFYKPGRWEEEIDELWEIAESNAQTTRQKNLKRQIKQHYKKKEEEWGSTASIL